MKKKPTKGTNLGNVTAVGDLPASGNSPGDTYFIGDNLYVWAESQWLDVGPVTGPWGPGRDASTEERCECCSYNEALFSSLISAVQHNVELINKMSSQLEDINIQQQRLMNMMDVITRR